MFSQGIKTLREANFSEFISMLTENQKNNFSNNIVITSDQGKGKSRVARLITKAIDPNFKYETHYIGNPQYGTTFKTLNELPHGSAVWIDEGEKVLATENRFDKSQFYLAQLFNQFRSHCKTIVICNPSFNKIDPRWRNRHIHIWIKIIQRGFGIVLRRRDIESSSDCWGLHAMKEHEVGTRSDIENPINYFIRLYSHNPCALFYMRFPNWESKEEEDDYNYWKSKSQGHLATEYSKFYENSQKEGGKAENALGRILSYFERQQNWTIGQLSELIGMDVQNAFKLKTEFEKKIVSGRITKLSPNYFDEQYQMKIRMDIHEQKDETTIDV